MKIVLTDSEGRSPLSAAEQKLSNVLQRLRNTGKLI